MIRTRAIIRTVIMSGLLAMTLAACGGDTGSNPSPTGTPNVAQTQPTATAVALATSTTAGLQAAATVTAAPPSDTPVPPSDTPVPPAAATPTTETPKPMPSPTPAYQPAVDAAKVMLAQTLGIPASQISLVTVTDEVWTDSNFGCPPSMGMAKLNIPGYKIILKAKGTNYEYRANADGSIVHICTQSGSGSGAGAGAGSGTGSGNTGGNTVQDQLTAAAKKDLATRLGVDEASIIVKSVTEEQWRDSNIGCGKGVALTVITPGYLIVLTANGADYEYHTDMNTKLVLCVNGAPAK